MRAGGLAALPTETVYGLAADAGNAQAVATLYAAKGRPRFNPLIAHVADATQARALGVFEARADALAEAFWPGPLTLVVPHRAASGAGVCELARAGLDTVAVRAPAHPVMQAVLRAVDTPLAAPSANPSGALSPTSARDVARALGAAVDVILNADEAPETAAYGVESTIVAISSAGATLLRPGPITEHRLQEVLGAPLLRDTPDGTDRPQSPGRLARHYAPQRARLRLNAAAADRGEVYLGFGPGPHAVLTLSPSGDINEAAQRLFRCLRVMDEAGFARVAVAPIPDEGLGAAINDRLRRAASDKNPG